MPKVFLLAACITASIYAQDSATFRVDTRLVEVDVVVHQKGEPVAGLTAGDFTLFDKGKKQRIALFSVRRDSEAQTPRSLPGMVTNRVGLMTTDGGETPSPTVILLDTLNSNPDDMAEVRRQLLLYLDRSPEHEVFSVYSLNKALNRLHNFSSDRDHLRDIVNRWIASASVDLMADRLAADLIADLPEYFLAAGRAEAAIKEMGDMAILNRASATTLALEMIAKHLSGLPGRKKLIWIGGGFPTAASDVRERLDTKQIEVRDYSRLIDQAIRVLNEAHVAVYVIDSRRPCSPTCSADPLLLRSGLETMNQVASATGGRAVYIVNNIAGAIEESVRDSEITYRLGFYPQSSAQDGKIHDVKVQVARKGVDVRYRRAYLAADRKGPRPEDRLELLRSGMHSPLDATQIGLIVQALPESVTDDRREILLRLDVRTLQLSTEETAKGETVSTAYITLATLFPNQSEVPADVNDLKLTFTNARQEEVLREGYLIRLQVDEAGVPGKMRIAVQDRVTAMTGSVTLDVQ